MGETVLKDVRETTGDIGIENPDNSFVRRLNLLILITIL